MSLTVRNVIADDADAVIAMNAQFVKYLYDLGDPDSQTQHFTKQKYLLDGFGPEPAFAGYIAEEDGKPLGYLLYNKGYNVDLAQRLFFICDLWVGPEARRKGVARALMQRCAADCRAWGGQWLEWYVFKPNSMAFDFYTKIGATVSDAVSIMSMRADAL